MRISGSGVVRAPAETVWASLGDRDVLLLAIPGLERLDVTGNGRYQFTLTIPIAAVSGTYSVVAELTHADPIRGLGATVLATGAKGSVDARITVGLSAGSGEGTRVSYEADAEVTGPVADIGQRLLASVAKRLAAEFLAGLDHVLSAAPAAERPAQPAAGQPPRQPAGQAVERVDQPAGRREQPGSAVRTGMLAGAAAGFGGVLIGVLLGRRSRSQFPGRR